MQHLAPDLRSLAGEASASTVLAVSKNRVALLSEVSADLVRASRLKRHAHVACFVPTVENLHAGCCRAAVQGRIDRSCLVGKMALNDGMINLADVLCAESLDSQVEPFVTSSQQEAAGCVLVETMHGHDRRVAQLSLQNGLGAGGVAIGEHAGRLVDDDETVAFAEYVKCRWSSVRG